MDPERLAKVVESFRRQQAEGVFPGPAGNFSTIAWADPTTGCAVAAVTNGNRPPTALVSRFARIGSGLRAACID